MKRGWRIALIGLVVVLAAPGTFVRSTIEPVEGKVFATPRAEPVAAQAVRAGPFELVGVWDIRSDDPRVGGYSAMALTGPDQLTAISDAGQVLRITLRDGKPAVLDDRSPPAIQRTVGGTFYDAKQNWDVESLTRDPDSGALWAAFEGTNAIERLSPAMESLAVVRPDDMRDWGGNSGPESLARLHDGRLITFREGQPRWSGDEHRGVMFDGDPIDKRTKATRFSLKGLQGYDPVDATAAPDGRVLVLLRKLSWGVPPGFASALMVVDPADITEGATISGTMLAELPDTMPIDNFEGMALSQEADGQTYLWLIADNNLMQIQRSLLMKLHWRAAE